MKKLLLILGIVVALIAIAIGVFVTLVNPNQFKPMITEQVYKKTGLELAIKGDIQWRFFPSLGIELGETALKNPAGFSAPNLIEVDQVGVQVAVSPLFSQQVEIGKVILDGAHIHIETLANGQSNLDHLTQKSTTTKPIDEPVVEAPPEPSPSTMPTSQWAISLEGVAITNAALDIIDHRSDSHTKLYDVSLSLDNFAYDVWTPISFAARGEKQPQTFSLQGSAQFQLSPSLDAYAVKDIQLNGAFADATNKFDSLSLTLDQFRVSDSSQLTFAVNGKAGEMNVDATGSSSVTLDRDFSQLTLDKLKLNANLTGEGLPQSPMAIGLDSSVTVDLNTVSIGLIIHQLTANAIKLDGRANVVLDSIPDIRFNLHSPNIDLDALLGLTTKTPASSNEPSTTADSANQGAVTQAASEPDLSALKTVKVNGQISIDKFKANNAHLQAIKTQFTVNQGVVDLNRFSASLYGGTVNAKGQLDGRKTPARFQATKQITGVQIQPLLRDVMDNDKLEGVGTINITLKGQGLTPQAIKQSLVANGDVKFADGAINGVNVAQMIREGYAKIKGQSLDGVTEPQKTDFSALTASFTANKGVLSTKDVLLQSPLLRITGKGQANYLTETVDMLVRTSVVGSLKGQGGKNIDELKDLTIPINISGSWAEPKFKLVFDDLLKKKAEKEIERGVEKLTDKIKDEKTKKAVDGLLKGLFN